jgi:signal recognition particle subunit SRP54
MESDAGGVNKRKLIQKAVVEELVNLVSSDKKPYKLEKGKINVIMFVGLQGSGKTTTCTKYAHYYNRKGWKTALVCADTFRAGAFDQLRQNASKVRIPFYGDYNETDPVKIAEEGVALFRKEKYDLILVDTSGRHRQEAALFEEMKQVEEVCNPDDTVFIMDSHIGQACFEQAKAFRECVTIGSVIVTKLDGHAKGGGALSAVAATGSPIIFLGQGEHFEDFQQFEAQSFVSRLLGMGDLKGLFQTITEAMPLDKQPELLNKISKGKFSIRDLYEQFQNLQKMGPMGQIMQMIPGMSQLMPKGAEAEGVKRIKRFMVMMDSLTDAELDCDVQLNERRRWRVAKGSGSSAAEVTQLLDEYKRMEKMVGKMGKSGLFGKGGDMTQLQRNPGQVMQKMQNSMDPRMLQQMGGAQNMMKMMKEFGKMENMGGMMDGLGGIDPSQLENMQKMMKGKMKGGRR